MPGGGSSVQKKWLPDEDADSVKFYTECKSLYKSAKSLVSKLKNTLIKYKQGIGVDQDFESNIEAMSQVVESMKRITLYQTSDPSREIESHKKNLWKSRLWIERLAISRLANDLIVQFLDSQFVESILRLAYLYNECIQLNISGDSRGVNVFCNTCPMLLYPLRKLSITKLLAALANKRAECCSYMLVEGLLSNYLSPNKTNLDQEEPTTVDNAETAEMKDETISGTLPHEPESEMAQTDRTEDEKITQVLLDHQDSVCSDTSVEIYRALTKHLMQKEDEQSESLQILLKLEEKRVASLLAVTAKVAPQLLPANCCKPSKTAGQPRVKKQVKRKLTDYYQEVLWSEVGGYLEHGLLWWSADPLGSFPPAHTQHLRDYVVGLKRTEFIPPLLVPSTSSLLDALCCHVMSTSWDQLFRKTLVAAGNLKGHVYSSYGIEGTATGQLFVEMLSDLIQLNNSCEDLYLSLEDLPLVEQIPILHRLDHSVHTVRLWAVSQCRQLASSWNVDEFYCTCYTDISKCLEVLSKVQLADHGEIPSTTSVQVTVCAKMRAKLVSEVRTNIEKLKKTPSECINVLASACRTECLANLHMCFPPPLYWRQNGPLPDCASDYVENYLDCILRPVLLATNKMELTIQQSSSSMVLRILCESWLEYIYLHRIKFSEWGAVQLLTDFGAVPTWLMERVQLKKELLNPLVAHEVLKRCEGVGRLLLRRRGESIAMSAPPGHRTSGEDTSADNNMPAEMYVPNQEQWLELRAPMRANMCCQL